jgi:tetratricopeptide (TPR) repeat protein
VLADLVNPLSNFEVCCMSGQFVTVDSGLGDSLGVSTLRELAISYWREGDFKEARKILINLLRTEVDTTEILQIRLNLAQIEEEAGNVSKSIRLFESLLPAIKQHGNRELIGKAYNSFGIALDKMGGRRNDRTYFDQAIQAYTAAGVQFEEDGNLKNCAIVESNIAHLHLLTDAPQRAHSHLDKALSIAEDLGDEAYLAWWRETRARVFIAEGRLIEALNVVTLALDYFEGSDNYAHLAATLVTFGTIQARLDHTAEARHSFARALRLYRKTGGNLGEVRRKIYNELQQAHRRSQERHQVLELKYEGKRFRQALREAGTRVTRAARLVGMEHGSFIHRLSFHPELESERTPPAKKRGRHARKA